VLGPHHEEVTGAGVLHRQHVLPSTAPKTTDAPLTDDQRTVTLLHAATRAPAERGNSLLETTFKALRRISLCPWRIGAITAAGRDGHGLGNRLRAGSAPPPARPHYPGQAVTENGSLCRSRGTTGGRLALPGK